jgi:hypothetical protein
MVWWQPVRFILLLAFPQVLGKIFTDITELPSVPYDFIVVGGESIMRCL